MARVVLIGLPGSGKSTVAAVVGSQLGVEVCDTDVVIAHRVGSTTADWLRHVGESVFRVAEFEALRDCVRRDAVVATGGGVVESEDARDLLAHEFTVWLDAPDEVLAARTSGGDRPLLGTDHEGTIAVLRARRSPWYEAVATVRVGASGSVEDVASRIRHAMVDP